MAAIVLDFATSWRDLTSARPTETQTPDERKAVLRDITDLLGVESAHLSVQGCGRRMVGDEVIFDPKRKTFIGTLTCKRAALCPSCGERARAKLRERAVDLVARHEVAGGVLGFLTVSPRSGPDLAGGLDRLLAVWARLTSGQWWTHIRARLGIVGVIRAIETKVNDGGYWHPHLHAVVLFRQQVAHEAMRDLQAEMHTRLTPRLTLGRVGVHLERVTPGTGATVAGYVLKSQMSDSLAAPSLAHGQSLTPFDLLRAVVAHGDAQALTLYRTWESVIGGKRRHLVSFTPGLDDLIPAAAAHGKPEPTTSEVPVGASEPAIVERWGVAFRKEAWRGLCRGRMTGELIRVAAGGLPAVTTWLDQRQIEFRVVALGPGRSDNSRVSTKVAA